MSTHGVSAVNSTRPVHLATSGQESATQENKSSGDTFVQFVQTGEELKTAQQEGVKVSIGEAQLIKAIDRAIKEFQGPQTTIEMKVHEATKAVTIKVMNKETGELIREIPPEKTLDLVAKMMEFAGILIDQKV
ncbi:flagellar protein FlaG [Cohnella sp. AR92]|uniref:flagellar protein FlaG n=1 Tax=Cohnella sp. AR92 TaxID=648716 RepID=UPI000F8D87D6|nr:flagellar protein FlaG [Cohnella sp. AR92]RUS43045.1 flagellar protein FlaG [Cohnella sp. AR92]